MASNSYAHRYLCKNDVYKRYNAFNVYRRELAPGTVNLTGDRAQGDDSKHWAYSSERIVDKQRRNQAYYLHIF